MQLQTQNLKLHTIKKINKYREIYLMLIDLLNIVCKDWHIPNTYLQYHTLDLTFVTQKYFQASSVSVIAASTECVKCN